MGAASLSNCGIVWSFLSLCSTGLCCAGFYLPYWLEGNTLGKPAYFGTFRRCNYPAPGKEGDPYVVEECGRYATFYDIPSMSWQICTVLVGIGCGFMILISFTALLACCVDELITSRIARAAGWFQVFAAILVAAGVVLYPNGWSSVEVQQACGNLSRAYALGTCKMSWSYYITIGGSLLTFLCSGLSYNAARTKNVHYGI
ncbi:PREDICTED: lipoma HMGIC fusion partner-like [Branchiostoma belcheri]|uniref:Lipoma HMGIC fusion partner-like n=1 Tax=Branchiostoma belcheri TaxID=7741 RepID=A0A6P5AK27_BRABE|nr:PREDICTED: lipoma HMGIC fusion partner-like [Branchiostoma belcheri]